MKLFSGKLLLTILGLFWFTNHLYAYSISQDDADISGIIIASIAWSPDGNSIAVGKGRGICGSDYGDSRFNIEILNIEGQLIDTFIGVRCTQTAIAWSPDGTKLVSTDSSASIWFWDVKTRTFLDQESVSFLGSRVIMWSPDSTKVYGIGDGSIYVYDYVDKTASGEFEDYRTKNITTIALSPDGSQLASGDDDGIIRILDTATKQTILSFAAQSSTPSSLSWHPDASMITSGFSDGTVRIWDVTTSTSLLHFQGHTKNVTVVAWSPSGDQFASASDDGSVRLWNTCSEEQTESYKFSGRVLTLAWSPNGDQIAYGGVRDDFKDTDAIVVSVSSTSAKGLNHNDCDATRSEKSN